MDQGSSLNFDFNSQAGVMSLLAAIRSSALSPVEKNELRDLVFLYTNGGGDVSVRIALEQKLIAHKIQPAVGAASSVPVSPAPVLSFGSSRPAPVFSDVPSQAPVSAPAPVPAPTPAVAAVPPPVYVQTAQVVQPASVYAVPVAPAPVYVQQPPVAAPAPVYVQPQPQPQMATTPVAPTPVYVQQPPVAAPAPVSIPVAPAPVAPVTNVAPAQGGVNYLDRIREIKSAVNSKVGNPVNLVDINNEVGREYMNALLDAMKRLSGGASGQIEVAMQRLESAYQAVEVAVAAHNQSKATTSPEPTPTSIVNEPASIEAPAVPAGSPIVGSWAQPQPEPEKIKSEKASGSEPVFINRQPLSTFELSPEEEKISGFNTPPAPAPEPQAPSVPVPTLNPVPSPAQIPVSSAITSLANEQRVRTPGDLPSADSITTSTSGDPLNTKEIDDGLDQLLSDWSLFKKSGLFGTGPRGREHPLFKKISGLQIPLVLAGRFEGSTQEIKQSITDYMNGWRYEQGIIYEQGETFEHYLRRVIKQILDLQKKRKPA